MLAENSVAHCGWKVATCFSRIIREMSRWAILTTFFMLVYALPGLAQPRKALTLNDISDLIRNGVRPNRIAQLVEEHGVGFELDDRALRRLKQDGANDTVLSAVKKMSAAYMEGSQQTRRQQEEEARRKREEEAKRRAEEQKRQQAKGTQEAARKVEETKRRPQEEAKQRSQRVNLLSREEVGRVASLQNVASTENGEVSGEVVNHSKQTLREVRLQILYSWRWKNEHRPGKDDPGRATYYALDKEIPPGQTVNFNYTPSPPLAARDDGEFDISVKVAGFVQVFPTGAAR
jgi:hypothetical protein